MAAKGKKTEQDNDAPVTIKKYANRRLYNTATSSYVTLEHLAEMVRDGVDFVVFDAKSGDDITRSVLTQIIMEAESKGQSLLPIGFLRHLISFYGDSLQTLVPGYLDQSMQSFARNQEQMRDYVQQAMGGVFPFGNLDEISKQNMALLENAMTMFSPFSNTAGAPDKKPSSDAAASRDETIDALASQLRALQQQLDALKPDGGKKS